MHVFAHARLCMLLHQSVYALLIYLCCKYQVVWAHNEWFIGLFVSANQNQAEVHARADEHFAPYTSIKNVDLYLRRKYQKNPLKNNEVIYQLHIEILGFTQVTRTQPRQSAYTLTLTLTLTLTICIGLDIWLTPMIHLLHNAVFWNTY